MTRTQPRPYGVITPSTRQPLLEAMLRAFVWLVSNVASLSRTIFNRNTRDWHTDAAQEDQPTPNDLTQETHRAETTGAPQALMVSSTQRVRPSNHEGVLTTGSVFKEHAFPAKAGIQTPHAVRTRDRRGSTHRLSSRKPLSGYPGPIRPHSRFAKWFPARAALGWDDNRERKLRLI